MTRLNFILFFHVAGVVCMFAALALEGVSLRNLRRATSFEQAQEWTQLWRLLLPLGLPAMVIALISGIYLATTLGAWQLSWVRPIVPTLLVIAVAGAIAGPRRNRLQALITDGTGRLPNSLRSQLQQPLFIASWRIRTVLMSGLVFVMTSKPDSPIAELVIAAVTLAAIAWSIPAWRTRSASVSANESGAGEGRGDEGRGEKTRPLETRSA
jgi:hypothetical protein